MAESFIFKRYESRPSKAIRWYVGTSKSFQYELDESTDEIPDKAWFTIKADAEDADLDAELLYEITQVSGVDGVIFPATASTNTVLQFDISSVDMNLIDRGKYISGIKCLFPSGRIDVLDNSVCVFEVLSNLVKQA